MTAERPGRIDPAAPKSVPRSLSGHGIALVSTAVLIAVQACGGNFASDRATIAASVAILALGLPHGAFDLELIRARRGNGVFCFAVPLGLYLIVAAAMAGLWAVVPLVALVAFLAVAVVHFAEDWTATGSPFLATGLAAALVATPAIGHQGDVAAIFVALTGDPAAAVTARLLLAAAPVTLAVAAAAIAALVADDRRTDAAAATASLAALLVLPPAVGFATFFCLFHSPRHFSGALRRLAWPRAAQWGPVAVPVVLAALGVVAILYRLHAAGAAPLRLTSATFMALSVLTVPHMLVPQLIGPVERWCGQAGRIVRHA